jgi:thioredoxin 1
MNTNSSNTRYNGPSIPFIGVETGMGLNEVVSRFATAFGSILNQKVSLGEDNKEMSLTEAVSHVNSKISNLKINDIAFDSLPQTSRALSYDGLKIMDIKMPISYSVSGENLVVSYNFTSLQSYGVLNAKVRYVGNIQGANRVIQDTSSVSGSVNIPLTSMPGSVTISVVLNTKTGDILLDKNIPVFSAQNKTETINFDIRDYSSDGQVKTFDDYISYIDRKIQEVSVFRDLIQKTEVQDGKNLPGQKGLLSLIPSVFSFSDDLKTQIDEMNKISIPGAQKEFTPQTAFDYVMDGYTAIQSLIKQKDSEIQNLQSEVRNLRGFYSSIVNNMSGGSTTIVGQSVGSSPGGCVGAGCGGGGTVIVETEPPAGNENMNTIITPNEIDDLSFKTFIASGVSIVDFYSDHCGYCVQMEPTIGYLNGYFNSEIQRVSFGKINITNNKTTKVFHGVFSAPTFIIFKNGAEVERHLGVQTFDFLRQRIESQL